MDQALSSSMRYADCTADWFSAQGCSLAGHRSLCLGFPHVACRPQQFGMHAVLMSEQQAQQSLERLQCMLRSNRAVAC